MGTTWYEDEASDWSGLWTAFSLVSYPRGSPPLKSWLQKNFSRLEMSEIPLKDVSFDYFVGQVFEEMLVQSAREGAL